MHIKLLHTHFENTDAFNPRDIDGPATYTREHLVTMMMMMMMMMMVMVMMTMMMMTIP